MTQHSAYVWHPLHKLYLTAHRLYLSSHPDYRSYTPILYMNTQPQYVWHHMNYLWHRIHSLWYHITLWHHTHCIHVITAGMPVIASPVAGPLLIVYWLYHTYYMCDMNPTVSMTSQDFYMTSHSFFMTSQYCIHDVTSTQFMTAHPRSRISHTLYLHHHSHCIYDKTRSMFMSSYSVYMTSNIVYQWKYNHGIWHHTHSICVITPTWLMI